jgi:hypothetical protein
VIDYTHVLTAGIALLTGIGGKYAAKLAIAYFKYKPDFKEPNGNGKAGSQTTIFWLEENDKIVKRNMEPVVKELTELKQINSAMKDGINRLVTIAEFKGKLL